MLELLHKLDQSKEREAASYFSSSDRNDVHEAETSDGSVGQLQRNRSSGSKGFGLQLAPPSQQLQNLDHIVYSQGSSRAPISPHISSDRSEIGDMPPVSGPSDQSLSSWREPNEGGNRNHISGASEQINGKFSMGVISGFPFSSSHPQSQHDAERALPGQSLNPTLHRLPSHSKEIENTSEGILLSQSILPSVPDISASASKSSSASALEEARSGIHPHTGRLPLNSLVSEASSMSLPSLTPGVSQQSVFSRGLSTTVPASISPGLLKPEVQSNDNDLQKGVDEAMELSASIRSESSRTGEAVQSSLLGNLSSSNHASPGYLPRSVSNGVSHQSYSLLNQMQAMKSAEMDLSDQTWKKFRGPDRGVDSDTVALGGNQLSYGQSAAAGDVQPSHPELDKMMFDLSGRQGGSWDANSASLHMDALRRSGSTHSSSSVEAFLRLDHSQINPLVGIGHPGTLTSAQALAVPDTRRMAAINHMEQARLLQGPTDSMLAHEQADQFHDNSGASLALARTKNISSQNLLPPEVADQGLFMKQKKRKIAATEVLAWHKEVMASARLQSAR